MQRHCSAWQDKVVVPRRRDGQGTLGSLVPVPMHFGIGEIHVLLARHREDLGEPAGAWC